MGRVKVWGSQRAGISSSAQGAAYRVQRAVMCDDVTDDVCRGGLLIALRSTSGLHVLQALNVVDNAPIQRLATMRLPWRQNTLRF